MANDDDVYGHRMSSNPESLDVLVRDIRDRVLIMEERLRQQSDLSKRIDELSRETQSLKEALAPLRYQYERRESADAEISTGLKLAFVTALCFTLAASILAPIILHALGVK